MFNWFKPKNKKNVVVPTASNELLSGMRLLKAFTTETEPKLAEYPKEKFSGYWETIVDNIPGGYTAKVRFYEYQSGVLLKQQIVNAITVEELKSLVNSEIVSTMSTLKR